MQGIMRSFTSCQATDMDRLIWFSLLLQYLPVTESMGCLSQPYKTIRHKIGQSAVLPCNVRSNCSPTGWHYEWFFFKENIHLRLKLPDETLKYKLDGASLHINSLHTNDSGIYHCAAVAHGAPARGMQHVGLGTTLAVKEKDKKIVRNKLLWVSFVLLAIYSLAIVTLIVKKYGCKSISRRMPKTDRSDSAKKIQFRDVLQEMYSRRNLKKSKHDSSPVEDIKQQIQNSIILTVRKLQSHETPNEGSRRNYMTEEMSKPTHTTGSLCASSPFETSEPQERS